MEQKIRKTVLIVDDEEDIRRYLSIALEDAGFNVVQASSGVEALDILKTQVPDAISLDIVMPEGSGVKFHREIRKNAAWSKLPILIVTGHARDDLGKADFEEMTMSGPGVYVEKPVTAENYVAAIRKITQSESSDQQTETGSIRNELKHLADQSDPDTLKAALDILKKNKK